MVQYETIHLGYIGIMKLEIQRNGPHGWKAKVAWLPFIIILP